MASALQTTQATEQNEENVQDSKTSSTVQGSQTIRWSKRWKCSSTTSDGTLRTLWELQSISIIRVPGGDDYVEEHWTKQYTMLVEPS